MAVVVSSRSILWDETTIPKFDDFVDHIERSPSHEMTSTAQIVVFDLAAAESREDSGHYFLQC